MAAESSGEKLIASNPNRGNFFIDEVVEAGIVLTGTEVKSLRAQSPNIRDSFVEVRGRGGRGTKLEAWLLNAHIAPYAFGNIWNHDPLRKRKLLLHSNQLGRMFESITQKGLSAIPVRMYFKKGLVKVEVGLGRGKKKYDKREDQKKKSAQREMDVARKRR
ncbi:MAG: SsrA-binding protein SmpB [Bdellovibrionota bacterium]